VSLLSHSPPLAEQKRIADKLEAVLRRVDACRARLDRVLALLKRFRQSVLANATSGGLTAEWRMTNGVNDEWDEVRVQDVAAQVFDGPFGSHLKTADYTALGIRVSRLENIGWMNFLAEKEAFISPAKYKTLVRRTLKKDDVVFSSFAYRIEARLAVVRKTIERLTPSVLAKAFRGELVPQDPNDEPASALLDRLGSQPLAKPAKAKRKTRK